MTSRPRHGGVGNVFAVAPDIDFTMVKISFVNTIGGFNAAVGLAPRIISCSWGSTCGPAAQRRDHALAAAIAAAVAAGIIVSFFGRQRPLRLPRPAPGRHLGRRRLHVARRHLRASDYASGFVEQHLPGRNVPDVSGLVGHAPARRVHHAAARAEGPDRQSAAGGTHPNGDETATNDGWAAISGTSAAAPQIAGRLRAHQAGVREADAGRR